MTGILDVIAGAQPPPLTLAAANSETQAIAWLSHHLRVTRGWFDSMMDRVSQRFTMHMRIYTIVFSVALASVAHLDALMLLERLSRDAELRAVVAATADSIQRQADAALVAGPNQQNLQQLSQRLAEVAAQMSSPRLRLIGRDAPIHGWMGFGALAGIRNPEGLKHLTGILMSCFLLSLGAPFWFNQLKALTNLRSAVARREEQERLTSPPASTGGGGVEARDLPPTP